MKARKPCVLIVDDEEIVCAGLASILGDSGQVEVVGTILNVADTQSAVERLQPDIVLIDYELDGLNLSRSLKQLIPELKTMILLPNNQTPGLFSLTMSAADAYCLKTITAEELFSAIESVLGNAAWIDPAITRQLISAHLRKLPSKKAAFQLTERELDILALIVEGYTNQQIADLLRIRLETVKTHLRNIISKMAVRDRTQAAVKALRKGVIK
ncbi:MAG: response regulator transcription factor [Candidatus Obscuribacterales bacterium]|nr:response regulator transcription factor [Candidatus Obscuribacterales bacterium]